jgi:hypothetical protein
MLGGILTEYPDLACAQLSPAPLCWRIWDDAGGYRAAVVAAHGASLPAFIHATDSWAECVVARTFKDLWEGMRLECLCAFHEPGQLVVGARWLLSAVETSVQNGSFPRRVL